MVVSNPKPIVEFLNAFLLLSGNYRLLNDIDFTEATDKDGDWDFIGNNWNSVGINDGYDNEAFTGTFVGGHHQRPILSASTILSKVYRRPRSASKVTQ